MELASLIPKPMLPSSQFTEIACRSGNLVVEKLTNNTTGRLGIDGNLELVAERASVA